MVDVVASEVPAVPPVHGDVRLRAGGAAANAAVAAAAAGADAAVVGRVGADSAGRIVEEEVLARGVRPLLAHDMSVPTGIVVATASGIVAARGANATLSPADLPDPLAADAVLISGWVLLQPDTTAAAQAALDRAHAEWVAVDPASARLLERFGRDLFFDMTARATAVFTDAGEAEALTGERDPSSAAAVLAERYRLVCVKLGPLGALAILDGRREHAAPREAVVGELFGAGDAFAGTLLALIAGGTDLLPALEQACDAGSLTSSLG